MQINICIIIEIVYSYNIKNKQGHNMSLKSAMTVSDLINEISNGALKKNIVSQTGVTNDRLTRTMDDRNGGTLKDLVIILNSYGYKLCASGDGGVIPINFKAKVEVK